MKVQYHFNNFEINSSYKLFLIYLTENCKYIIIFFISIFLFIFIFILLHTRYKS